MRLDRLTNKFQLAL
nr:alpha protein, ClpB=NH2-terminus [Escherichia coli, Peptide Partial, 14 aa] [Escherichia coli]